MSEKNILMKQNTSNGWVTLYPITKSENVKTKNGNLQQDLDRLNDIGGRNILPLKYIGNFGAYGQDFNILNKKYKNIPIIEMIVTKESRKLFGWYLKKSLPISGRNLNFTISFYYKIIKYDGPSGIQCYAHLKDSKNYLQFDHKLINAKDHNNWNKWFKCEYSFIFEEDINKIDDIIFYFNNAKLGTHILSTAPKLEFGNVATDYSPAEEDIQDKIDSKINYGKTENSKSSLWFCEV